MSDEARVHIRHWKRITAGASREAKDAYAVGVLYALAYSALDREDRQAVADVIWRDLGNE